MLLFLITLFIFLIVYTYFVYPILLYIANRRQHIEPPPAMADWPTVNLIIAAHNEEAVIRRKLQNSLALDYPADKLRITVAADGCTDRTVEIINTFADKGIELSEQAEHLGKTGALNAAVAQSQAEIIVFSDANSMYQPDAVQQLVRHFGAKDVGCVCGNLTLGNTTGQAVGQGEGLYWRYEKWIKQQESQFAGLIGANGSIFAIRRELYTPLDLDIIDDFTTPLLIRRQGYRVVYEPKAVCTELADETSTQGFRRKVRIILRQLVALKRYRATIQPFSGILGFQMISHKVLRWLVPFFMLAVLVGTLFIIDTGPGIVLFIGQIVFYSSAFSGFLLEKTGRSSRLLRVPYYFCLMNLAALIAILQFSRGKTQPKWRVVREK